MKVSEALQARKSVRAFLDKAVEQEKINRILNFAKCAPSGTNTQPWEVAVVSGQSKQKLDAAIIKEFSEKGKGHPSYNYYPEKWQEPFKSRRIACGLQMYKTLQISREDKERQVSQWAANYRAFDAPVALYFFLDEIMETGSFMDYGMFLQSIMLMAMEEGLATCPQAALAEFPDLVKTELGYESRYQLICGMALGYEDADAVINSYRTPREELETFTRVFS